MLIGNYELNAVRLDDDGEPLRGGEYFGIQNRLGNDFGYCCATFEKAERIVDDINASGRYELRVFPVRQKI